MLTKADAALQQGQLEDAAGLYDRARTLWPEHPRAVAGLEAVAAARRLQARIDIATRLVDQGQLPEARRLIDELLAESPHDARAEALSRRAGASVFAAHRLDGLILPQMREQLAPRDGQDYIHETTVSEINIAGLPGVTFPAGYYASGAPFNLIAVGPMWSEADLLGFAYAYEQATRYRKPPVLAV